MSASDRGRGPDGRAAIARWPRPVRPRLLGGRQAQPAPDDPDPGDRHLRPDPADHVRGAVQLRLRRIDRWSTVSSSPAVYREFLMAGIFAQTVTFATAGAGAGIADDMHKGVIDRFRSLPMTRGAVLTGRTIADLVQTALTVVVLAIVGCPGRLADPQRHPEGPRRVRAAAAPGLRVLLDRCADRPVRAHARGGHLRRPDLAVPGHVHLDRVRGLQRRWPSWLQPIAEWNPFSATVQACRVLFGNPGVSTSDAWPMQHPAGRFDAVVAGDPGGVPHARGAQIPVRDRLIRPEHTSLGTTADRCGRPQRRVRGPAAVSSVQSSDRNAFMMVSVTMSGCDTMTTCDASRSTIFAPARWAISRTTSAPIV